MQERKDEEESRPSNLVGNNNNSSMISEQSSLIGEKKPPNRYNLSEQDKKRVQNLVNLALEKGKEEVMNFQEVSVKKSLFFRLFISGTIEYGNFTGDEPIKTKYEFVAGDSWEKEDGLISDETQFSCPGEGVYNYYSYGQHFGISYRSINPFGWPQIVLNCCSIDSNGKEVVKGYGCVHVPSSTGRHTRKVHIFNSTNSGSFWSKFCGNNFSCFGEEKKNEITNTPKVISSGQGREISRAICEGWINVIFQVSFRDVEKFGLIIK